MHDYPRHTEDAEPDEAADIYGVFYEGFTGLAGFRDRSDLPFIREAARWASSTDSNNWTMLPLEHSPRCLKRKILA